MKLSAPGEYGYITQTLIDDLATIYTEVNTFEVARQFADKVAAGGWPAPVDEADVRRGVARFCASERTRMKDGGGQFAPKSGAYTGMDDGDRWYSPKGGGTP